MDRFNIAVCRHATPEASKEINIRLRCRAFLRSPAFLRSFHDGTSMAHKRTALVVAQGLLDLLA